MNRGRLLPGLTSPVQSADVKIPAPARTLNPPPNPHSNFITLPPSKPTDTSIFLPFRPSGTSNKCKTAQTFRLETWNVQRKPAGDPLGTFLDNLSDQELTPESSPHLIILTEVSKVITKFFFKDVNYQCVQNLINSPGS
jgi:hypothetical protein